MGRVPSSSYQVTSRQAVRRHLENRQVNAMTRGQSQQGSGSPSGSDTLTVPTISLPAHGLDHPGGAENLAVIGGGVLAAAIGMVDQAGRRLLPLDGHGQSRDGQFRPHVVTHRPADDFAGEEIEHNGQIEPLSPFGCYQSSLPSPGNGSSFGWCSVFCSTFHTAVGTAFSQRGEASLSKANRPSTPKAIRQCFFMFARGGQLAQRLEHSPQDGIRQARRGSTTCGFHRHLCRTCSLRSWDNSATVFGVIYEARKAPCGSNAFHVPSKRKLAIAPVGNFSPADGSSVFKSAWASSSARSCRAGLCPIRSTDFALSGRFQSCSHSFRCAPSWISLTRTILGGFFSAFSRL
jgi:hypothetical protein